MKSFIADGVELTLPTSWSEHTQPGGPFEYWGQADGKTGLLQVSRFQESQFKFISEQQDLGALGEAIGKGLGKKQNWGQAAGHQQGNCGMGRFGMSVFKGGQFPAMLLWVTVGREAAYLWTWLGPDPSAPEVRAVLDAVIGSREAAAK